MYESLIEAARDVSEDVSSIKSPVSSYIPKLPNPAPSGSDSAPSDSDLAPSGFDLAPFGFDSAPSDSPKSVSPYQSYWPKSPAFSTESASPSDTDNFFVPTPTLPSNSEPSFLPDPSPYFGLGSFSADLPKSPLLHSPQAVLEEQPEWP
jgi:hypothetical protein